MYEGMYFMYLETSKSRHMVVCCAAQENGAHENYVSILTGTTKSRSSCICNSMIFYPKNTKVAVEVPAYQKRPHTRKSHKLFRRYEWASFQVFPSFFFFFLVFLHIWKNRCNSQICTPIQLKFGTLVDRSEVIISINFGENLYKILRIIIDYLHKTRTIFRQACKVNCWLDQPENWYVVRFNIRRMPLGG